MTEQNDPKNSSMVNKDLEKNVSASIQKEVTLPENSDGSDIEIIEVNVKIRNRKKKKSNLKPKFRKMKKVDPLKAENQALNAFIDVQGLQIPIKTLLQNEDIRKQLEPYIQQEVVYPVWISSSDSEDLNNKEEKNLLHSSSTVNENILSKSSQSIKRVTDNANLATEKEVKNTEVLPVEGKKETEKEIQIFDLVNLSDDESLVTKNNKEAHNDEIILNQNKRRKKSKTCMRRDTQVNKKKRSDEISQLGSLKLKNSLLDKNVVTIDVIEDHKTSDNQDKLDQDLSVMDSDDWYYLNIANNLNESYVENDTSVVDKTIHPTDLDTNQIEKSEVKIQVLDKISNETDKIGELESSTRIAEAVSNHSSEVIESEVNTKTEATISNKPRRNGRRKRRKAKFGYHNNKLKLQGRVVKKNIQSVNQHKHSSAILENFDNSIPHNNESIENPDDIDQLPIVKEESELSENIVTESLVNLEPTLKCNGIYDNFNSELQLAIKQEKAAMYHDTSVENEPEWDKNDTEIDNACNISTDQKELENDKSEKMDERLLPKLTVLNRIVCREKQIPRRLKYFGTCTECGKKYERIGNLIKHEALCKAKIEAEIIYECVMCPYKTKKKAFFKEHLGNHIFGKAYNQTNHNRAKSQRPFKTKKERKKEEMEKKEYYSANYIKYRCVVCNEEKISLKYKENCERCSTRLILSCTLCSQNFPTYRGARKHVAVSLRFQKQKKCFYCGKGGHFSKCKFKKHTTICRMKSKICSDKIPYVRLVRHELQAPRRVTPVVQTYCSKCEETKLQYEQITKCNNCESHLLLKCEICSKLLTSRQDLRSHVLSAHIIGSCNDSEDDLGNKKDHQINIESNLSSSLSQSSEKIIPSIYEQSNKNNSECTSERPDSEKKHIIPSNYVEKNTTGNGDILSETATTAEEVINKAPSTELIRNFSEIGHSTSNNHYSKISRMKSYNIGPLCINTTDI